MDIIIDVDFEIDKNLDIQLGSVYQGEPMSGGLKAIDLNIRTASYTSGPLEVS